MDIMKMGKNPNYLGSWDLQGLPRQEVVLTIKKIIDEKVPNNGREEACTVCYFEEDGYKPMILNITNKKTLCRLYKTKDTEKLIGKRATIYIEQVRAFGSIHDALRIRGTVPQPKQTVFEKCESCGGDIRETFGMSVDEYLKYSVKNCGRKLCADCLRAEAEKKKGSTK